ncbi:MAG: NGG1p interacting factor NIF3 [Coxiellaceae bacterium]|nr:NGG1p interacting factor NIF3 [Coxiellaceae bacterium]
MKNTLYQFYYYVPKSHLAITKKAIFSAGAGNIGNYSCCSWQTKGLGQFKPEPKSNAYIGKIGKIAKVPEYKVETVCMQTKIKAIIKALKKNHPYECPAYGFIKLTII